MEIYEELLDKYVRLQEEFETYQNFAETNIQMLNEKNTNLEKRLDSLSSIIEVSKYINSNVRDKNFIPMINDVIMGILGVIYSTIYIIDDGELKIKATNIPENARNYYDSEGLTFINSKEPIIINSREPIFSKGTEKSNIHSIIGLPITLKDDHIGYIIVEHSLHDFFGSEHMKYISAIANQVGIAIENNFLYNKVKETSVRDPLLGIYNRRFFFDELELRLANQEDTPFAIVMVDLDNFKKINDQYGHQFGDEVLIQTVKLIERSVSKEDIVARYGGEEIVLYISEALDKEKVFEKVDRIREKISENTIYLGQNHTNITASFGLSFYPDSSRKIEQVIDIADKMMYNAKKAGKNRVMSA